MGSLFRCMFAVGLVLALYGSSAAATDLYGTPQGADLVLQSARPGEYYYNLGADAVRHKDYAHAVEMYTISASWAHKTSEYNLGVMYARGEGVAVDLPRALAWMALAAERNDKEYVQARDLIASMLDKNGIAQAEAILKELLPTYGDAVALNRAKTRWREVRNEATGSHVGFTGNLSVGEAGQNAQVGKNPLGTVGQAAERKFLLSGKEGGGKSSAPAAGSLNSGEQTGAGLIGATGIDGSKAYADLRATDNPYDPRLSRGVATVGPLAPVAEKKSGPETVPAEPRADEQQKQ